MCITFIPNKTYYHKLHITKFLYLTLKGVKTINYYFFIIGLKVCENENASIGKMQIKNALLLIIYLNLLVNEQKGDLTAQFTGKK